VERSLAGRVGFGRAARPPGPAAHRRSRRVGAPLRALAASLGSITSTVWHRRRLRLALLAALIILPLLTGGWMWLRHSSLVAVRRVQVSGVHGSNAHEIEAAMRNAARHMSTLDVHTGALLAAAAPFRVVRDVRVSTSFPHGLKIHVIEQPAVAALTVAGTRTAVAADGVILGPGLLSGSLPTLEGKGENAASGRVQSAALLGALSILGAAPASLAKEIERTYSSSKGLTVAMRGGLSVYFGDGSRPHAKWASLARVLADPSSPGAIYVDVRVPERPAAGFASGSAPASSSTSTSSEASSSESTEALANGLSATAAAGGAGSASSAPSESSSSSEAANGEGGEESSQESSQASSESSQGASENP
jgi:cell division protein FtsQ